MTEGIPANLLAEQRAVEAQIREAFHGISRVGGISWSESDVVDNCGSEAELAAANAQDTERCWEDLIDDPNWDVDGGFGGFSFLDPIGFAYYIAPAMVRSCRNGGGEPIVHALTVNERFQKKLVSRLSARQAQTIARFVRLMIAIHKSANGETYGDAWQVAYQMYWRQWGTGDPLIG
ncbi:MAG: hypothetical protein H7210_00575 [Pyrinomonadaceae bacterium]|nr:hypothetical protein [Phycisphaerales bacterium]